jgi:hypothetical protein
MKNEATTSAHLPQSWSGMKFLGAVVRIITLVFCFTATMPKLGGNRGEQAKRIKAKEEAKEAEPDLSSSNSSSGNSSISSGSSISSSSSGNGNHHNKSFPEEDLIDNEADILDQENCDYDSDNETSDEWRALMKIVVDEGFDEFRDEIEEDFGIPLIENMEQLEIEVEEHEKRWKKVGESLNKRFCGNSRATYYRNKSKVSDGLALDLKAASNTFPLSHFFAPQGNS